MQNAADRSSNFEEILNHDSKIMPEFDYYIHYSYDGKHSKKILKLRFRRTIRRLIIQLRFKNQL